MYEEDESGWYIEGNDPSREFNYIDFGSFDLKFSPSDRKNLLGHAAEWTAELTEDQMRWLADLADDDGWGLKVQWGVFMCPAHLRINTRQLVVNTEGVW